jgi:TonB family protein
VIDRWTTDPDDEPAAGIPRAVVTRWRVAAVASLAAHLVIGGFAVRAWTSAPVVSVVAPARSVSEGEVPLVIDLPVLALLDDQASAPGTTSAAERAELPTPELASGARVARPDDPVAGKGGETSASAKARNLAAHTDDETRVDGVRDAIVDEQENRLKTAKSRASPIDLRVALEPMELTFVASPSAPGRLAERRAPSPIDPARGVPHSPQAALGDTSLGTGEAVPATTDLGDESIARRAGSDRLGAARAAPRAGVAYGQPTVGAPVVVGAKVVKARPLVDRGRPSVASEIRGPSADTADADLAVAGALKSLVTTSSAGGANIDGGRGGSGGGGDPGAGGASGGGSRTAALGQGGGDGPQAIARTRWYLDLQKKIGPLLRGTFPREHELELRNGTVIVDLVIAKGGGVLDVIVVRPSGFGDFDQNVVDRMRGASALPPVPDALSIGPITVRVPVTGGWKLQ